MSVNYPALKGERDATGFPEDGLHTARLHGTEVIPVDGGARARLKTTWVDNATGLLFDAWYELTDQERRAGFRKAIDETIDLLDGLGIDRDALGPSNPIEHALIACVGRDYQISTRRWGNPVAGVNLTIEDQLPLTAAPDYRPAPTTQPLTDVPVDPSEMTSAPALPFGDDDIPF